MRYFLRTTNVNCMDKEENSYNASTGDWCKNEGNPGDDDYTDSFDFFIQDGKLVIKYYYRDALDTEKNLYT